jgi:hypothetical protein
MTVAEIKNVIECAFANTPHPGNNFSDISATRWDEGIVDYFRRSTWRGHQTTNLRKHVAALSFFTHQAFRYWLPAFMLAELEEPEKADVISQNIAYSIFDESRGRLELFTVPELEAISAFLAECARRYRSSNYRNAHEKAEARIKNFQNTT